MGLLDFGAKVVLTYKADVSDAKAKLRELSGEEKKLAAERLKHEEAHNKGLERQIKGIGLLAAGIGAAVGAIALAKVGLDAYAKTSEQAAAKVNDIKTSTSNAMESVQASIGKTVVAMEPLIKSIADIVKLLGDAGAAGPLAMGALALAISGNPVIAALVLGASSGTDPADIIFDAKGWRDKKLAQNKLGADGALKAVQASGDSMIVWRKAGSVLAEGFGASIGRGILGREAPKPGKAGPGKWSDVAGSPYTDWTPQGGEGSSGAASQQMAADSVPRDMYGNAISDTLIAEQVLFEQREQMTADWLDRLNVLTAGPSIIERMLGPVQDIDMYRESFSMLTGAATAGYDAMIDGTMSFGAAVKQSVADALKALGKKFLVQALGEGAQAIGSAAMYDYKAAGEHASAAVMYGAAAAAAGAGAAALGGGGGGGGRGGGYRPSAPSGGGSSGAYSGGSNVTIVYGDQFADDSPRNRQRTAQKLVAKALGTSGGTYS